LEGCDEVSEDYFVVVGNWEKLYELLTDNWIKLISISINFSELVPQPYELTNRVLLKLRTVKVLQELFENQMIY